MTKAQLEATILQGIVDVTVGVPAAYSKPVTYVVTQSGLWCVRDVGVATSIARVSPALDIPIAGPDLTESLTLHYPRIPWVDVHRILCFFRKVYTVHKAEAYASVWWNPSTQEYETEIPIQTVSGGSVEHAQTFDREGVHVLDIHSHASMAPFFSAGDDRDERFGHFCSVVGHVNAALPKWQFRLRVKDEYVRVPSTLLVEPATVEVKASVNLAMEAEKPPVTEVVVDMWSRVEEMVPAEWMERVRTRPALFTVGAKVPPYYRSGYRFDDEFDWDNDKDIPPMPVKTVTPPTPKGKWYRKGKVKDKKPDTNKTANGMYIFTGEGCRLRKADGSEEAVDLDLGGNR